MRKHTLHAKRSYKQIAGHPVGCSIDLLGVAAKTYPGGYELQDHRKWIKATQAESYK